VGDLEHEAALERVSAHFGSIPRGPQPSEPPSEEPPQRGERSVSVEKEVQLPAVVLAYRCAEGADREARVLNMVEFLLLHGRSSRLYQSMIYQKQLASGLSGGLQFRAGPCLFRLQATARPGVEIAAVRGAFEEALETLKKEPVGEVELGKVRRGVESDFVFSQDGHLEVALNLGEDECRRSWTDYLSWMEECLSVTPEEIQEVANRVFQDRNRTVGNLVPVAGAA